MTVPADLAFPGTARAAAVAGESHELLRAMLEERFAIHTARLTELTVYGRVRAGAGYDPQTLEALMATARQGVADNAQALRRMSEGTYGICQDCGRSIPLGRLHAVPHARYCSMCRRRRSH